MLLLLFLLCCVDVFNSESIKLKRLKPVSGFEAVANQLKVKSSRLNSIFSELDDNNNRVLTYCGLMVSGAIARSVATTAVHPLNVIKTMLQCRDTTLPELTWRVLSRGAGAQFVLSIPHGAMNFAFTETAKEHLESLMKRSRLLASTPENVVALLLDFLSCAFATFACSVISTPQMVITDRMMAGMHDSLISAVTHIYRREGIRGFYVGWLPSQAQKIPSYALTWMFFQQFKRELLRWAQRSGTALENTVLGALAASVACCIMIPLDTVKTRIVTQHFDASDQSYDGMVDCLRQIVQQEGVSSLYRALPPRLLSVVPMIGIQYGVYELVKRFLIGPQTCGSVDGGSDVAATLPIDGEDSERESGQQGDKALQRRS